MVTSRRFRIGDWLAHPESNTLDGPGGSATLEPRSMDVLVQLASRAGEVCSRQELLDAVWGTDAFVGEAVLSHASGTSGGPWATTRAGRDITLGTAARGVLWTASGASLGLLWKSPGVQIPAVPRGTRQL